MEQNYWLARQRSAIANAKLASSSETRLIHLHLAGTYSVKAAACQVALQLPAPPMTEQPAVRS